MNHTAGLPAEVHLLRGEVVRIPLAGAMGAGNTWTVTVDDDRPGVVSARIVVTPPPTPAPTPAPAPGPGGGPAPLPPPSSSATETLEVTALGPGRADLHLRLGRSWEPEPLAHHTLVAVVS